MLTMALPGTKFIMDGKNGGRLVGHGCCCFSAVGNSMQNAGVLFWPNYVVSVVVAAMRDFVQESQRSH